MLAIYLQVIESEEDKSQFEVLYYRYRKLMYYIAIEYLNDEHLAEDAVSETFLKLAQKFERIQSIGDISGSRVKRYVAVSIKNTAINMAKRNKRYPEEELNIYEIEDVSESVINSIIEEEEIDIVLEAIHDLPDIYRDVLELYTICEHDIADIADILDISKGAAYKRLQRARGMLKKKMEAGNESS